MTRKRLNILVGLLVAVLTLLSAWRLFEMNRQDADLFYHFFISKKMVTEQSILQVVPEIEDMGWGEAFMEKEFLFHIWTALGYFLGGEKGVYAVACFMTLFFVISLLYMLSYDQKAEFALLFLLLPMLLAPTTYFFRIFMVRPHVWAMGIMLWLIFALRENKPKWIFAAAFIYGLSYHAFYLPLVFVFIAVVVGQFAQSSRQQCALWGIGGLCLGYLANPYFPWNVSTGIQHLMVGMQALEISAERFGVEVLPYETHIYLRNYSFFLLVAVFAIWQCSRFFVKNTECRPESSEENFKHIFIGVSLLAAIGMSLLSRRGIEYVAPLTSMTLALYAKHLSHVGRYIGLVVSVSLLLQGGNFIKGWGHAWPHEDEKQREHEMFLALAKIPESASGEKVFHCEWSHSPYVLYKRPDLRVIDVLDPSFLALANPSLFKMREAIRAGKVPDMRLAISGIFKADYVLCDYEALNSVLERDPHFQRIFPESSSLDSSIRLYTVAKKPRDEYVRELILKPLENTSQIEPWHWQNSEYLEEEGDARMTSLFANMLQQPSLVGQCVNVEIPKEEIKRLAHAEYVGIGTGSAIRLWLNETPLFSNYQLHSSYTSIEHLIPLPHPLRDHDVLKAQICHGDTSLPYALSLSLWDRHNLHHLCQEKWVGSGDFDAQDIWSAPQINRGECLLR